MAGVTVPWLHISYCFKVSVADRHCSAVAWLTGDLSVQASNVFAGKHGLITPRDLFRWAQRGSGSYLQLAQHGYMLLAERLRSPREAASVQDALQRILKVQVGSCTCTGQPALFNDLGCHTLTAGSVKQPKVRACSLRKARAQLHSHPNSTAPSNAV